MGLPNHDRLNVACRALIEDSLAPLSQFGLLVKDLLDRCKISATVNHWDQASHEDQPKDSVDEEWWERGQ